MSKSPRKGREVEDDRDAVTEADIEAWAAAEKRRRQAWLEGPTEEEKQAWADSERLRRLSGIPFNPADVDTMIAEGRRVSDRVHRDLSLALAGAASEIVNSPYRILGSLIRAGRELEDEHYTPRRRSRRVPMDAED
jgi:hypothetical protein